MGILQRFLWFWVRSSGFRASGFGVKTMGKTWKIPWIIKWKLVLVKRTFVNCNVGNYFTGIGFG